MIMLTSITPTGQGSRFLRKVIKCKTKIKEHPSNLKSQLAYVSEVWASQSCIRGLKLLEGVQRLAIRYILGHHRDPNSRPSYKSRLVSSFSLQGRQRFRIRTWKTISPDCRSIGRLNFC